LATREKILEVAETRFAREGFAGAHLQAIAAEVGVQKTALYYYFPSKAALYGAVLERMLESFDRTIEGAVGRDLPPADRLARLLDDLNDLLAERPSYSKILIRIFVDRAEVDRTRTGPVIERIVGGLLRFYREGVDAGAFRRLSSRHFFQSLLGLVVFHYATRELSAAVLGVDSIFTRGAVAWRRDEVRRLVEHGVLKAPEGEEP